MNVNELRYSKMTIDRLKDALDLITDVYHKFNGKDDFEEGKEKFKELIDYDWHKRHLEGEFELLEQPEVKLERKEEGMIFIGSFYLPPDFRMWMCEDKRNGYQSAEYGLMLRLVTSTTGIYRNKVSKKFELKKSF